MLRLLIWKLFIQGYFIIREATFIDFQIFVEGIFFLALMAKKCTWRLVPFFNPSCTNYINVNKGYFSKSLFFKSLEGYVYFKRLCLLFFVKLYKATFIWWATVIRYLRVIEAVENEAKEQFMGWWIFNGHFLITWLIWLK